MEAFVEWMDWARALFALMATLALIVGVAYGARRLGMLRPGGDASRRLKLVESLMIDPRRRMVIVRCDGRDHLLLLSAAGDLKIGETDAPPETPSQPEVQ